MSSLSTVLIVLLFSANCIAQQLNSSCFYDNGNNYRLEWNVDANNVVHFNLTYKNFPSGDGWTGVSFGPNMAEGMDTILVMSTSRGVSTADASVKGYQPPTIDPVNNVKTEFAQLNGQTLNAVFNRVITGSQYDTALDSCIMWHFVTASGGMTSTGTPTKHSSTPMEKQVCDIQKQCIAPLNRQNVVGQGQLNNGQGQSNNGQGQLNNGQGQSNNGQGQSNTAFTTRVTQRFPTSSFNQGRMTVGPGCATVDPDWCLAYVTDFLVWQQRYNRLSLPQACVPLMNSLLYAPSQCCQNLRVNGC